MSLFKKIIVSTSTKEERKLCEALTNLIGFKPHHLPFYIIALTHRSCDDTNLGNNERLEFLGDAFIGSIVASYLFKKYPTEDEGYLTDMRSKIVSRKSMDEIGRRMGIHNLLRFNRSEKLQQRSHIVGNAVEALVGAVYLDVGYKKAERFFINRVLEPHINMDKLEQTDYNFKNKLYCWAQHYDKVLDFVTLFETREGGRKVFTVGVFVDDEEISTGTGYSKKEAGQRAAEQALEVLNITSTELEENL